MRDPCRWGDNILTKDRFELALKELDIALANRVFEIQSFWQRSNYFLVLLTALGAATFTIDDKAIQAILSALSAVCAWFWYRTNLGSKFWQESWEVEVNLLSEKIGIESFKRSMAGVKEQVHNSLLPSNTEKNWLRKFVDRQTVSKPSVTFNMIILSLVVFIVWVVVSIIFVARLLNVNIVVPCL